MRADGRDKRGQGSAKATIDSILSGTGDATQVQVVTDFTLTGRLARFGRGGMIEDVSNRLLADFVACLRSSIEQSDAGVRESDRGDRRAESTAGASTDTGVVPGPHGPLDADKAAFQPRHEYLAMTERETVPFQSLKMSSGSASATSRLGASTIAAMRRSAATLAITDACRNE